VRVRVASCVCVSTVIGEMFKMPCKKHLSCSKKRKEKKIEATARNLLKISSTNKKNIYVKVPSYNYRHWLSFLVTPLAEDFVVCHILFASYDDKKI
jgi:hypothetical protein